MDENKIFYEKMQIIKTALLKREIPDEYPENISEIKLQSFKYNFYIDRFDFINISSFSLVSNKWVRPLSEYIGDKKCLEIMAGKGVLSKCLHDNGVDIIATDDYTWKWHRNRKNKSGQKLKLDELWYDVEDLNCLEAIDKYGGDSDYIICSWPPYGTKVLYKALLKMREIRPKSKMIYIGENKGGCNAEIRFFNEAVFINDDIKFNEIASLYQCWPQILDRMNLLN